MDTLETALGLIDDVVWIAAVVAVGVCFRKGRRGFGWFGVANFTIGLPLWFWLFVRMRDVEGGVVAMYAVALAIYAVLIAAALRPALPGSPWERRQREKAGVGAS